VIVEGAGSPAEINLRDRDIANMGFAEAADVPVILIADIDRGGVFAHLVGTLDLLSASPNRRASRASSSTAFAATSACCNPASTGWKRTGKPVLGVLPYLHGLMLDAEDAIATHSAAKPDTRLKAVAIAYPRCSNHNDLDPLRLHPEVDFRWIGPGDAAARLRPHRAARLQGGAGRPRLAARAGPRSRDPPPPALRRQADRHLRRLPDARPRAARSARPGRRCRQPAGLGLLDCETELEPEKQLRNVTGDWHCRAIRQSPATRSTWA
jgi:adenosylcobyric acid synthase